ncbi:MAG: hypothetical protein J7L95_01490 [Prolixibacteraceae bacterium]|nr:hypothetical protein [Prolixibacteraceae bacterium]
MFNPKIFTVTELENQLIISEKNVSGDEYSSEKDTIPVKYFFLTGKIVDDKRGNPIKFASVSVLNKPIGTITNSDFEEQYKYNISKVIWYINNPVYVLEFQPISNLFFPAFVGQMYIHRETFAIVHAEFHFNRQGLKTAKNSMIKKKPRSVNARPLYVNYTMNYQQFKGKWHLANARASVKFKIKSKRDKLNSEYHSVSDILITYIQPTELKKFARKELFNQHDIFVEMLNNYDSHFWENYNIIKPDEDLRHAFKK